MKFLWQTFLVFLFIFNPLAEPNSAKTKHNKTSNKHYTDKNPSPKGKYKNKKKHGIWLYYFSNGTIERKEKWKNGKLLWQVHYDMYKRKLFGINAQGDTSYYKGCNCAN
ncbi:MAG: hypothetical protein MH472_10315 [Bacteroidia bacterium]|nr:hypothetical protein [Bacteroidia bacterium]